MKENIRTDVTGKIGALTPIVWFRTRTVGGILWTLSWNWCLNNAGNLFNGYERSVFAFQKWLLHAVSKTAGWHCPAVSSFLYSNLPVQLITQH